MLVVLLIMAGNVLTGCRLAFFIVYTDMRNIVKLRRNGSVAVEDNVAI